jgi:hypothetical protein
MATIEIDSAADLTALLRAILEAKFHAAPNDDDVPGSSILAALANRICDALTTAEIQKEGPVAHRRWLEWRALTPARREWNVAISYATRMWATAWPRWSERQREDAARDLVAPLLLTQEGMDLFLEQVRAGLGL